MTDQRSLFGLRGLCRRSMLMVLALFLAAPQAGPSIAAGLDDVRVEITADQRTTVVGLGGSTREIVEELCWQAHVDFAYDGPDRPFAIDLEERPLPYVLSRLLLGQSYVLKVRPAGSEKTLVTALHVLGESGAGRRQANASAPETGGAGPDTAASEPIAVPAVVLEAAFGDGDPAAREHALLALIDGIRSNPRRARSFVNTDAEQMAEVLRRYPRARMMLEEIVTRPDVDATLRQKVHQIIVHLE